METNVTDLIEILDERVAVCGVSAAPEHQQEALQMQLTANCLRRFRDTLISIANCQVGIASHKASTDLLETGHCAHESCKFESDADAKISLWPCLNCGKESDQCLMPFE